MQVFVTTGRDDAGGDAWAGRVFVVQVPRCGVGSRDLHLLIKDAAAREANDVGALPHEHLAIRDTAHREQGSATLCGTQTPNIRVGVRTAQLSASRSARYTGVAVAGVAVGHVPVAAGRRAIRAHQRVVLVLGWQPAVGVGHVPVGVGWGAASALQRVILILVRDAWIVALGDLVDERPEVGREVEGEAVVGDRQAAGRLRTEALDLQVDASLLLKDLDAGADAAAGVDLAGLNDAAAVDLHHVAVDRGRDTTDAGQRPDVDGDADLVANQPGTCAHVGRVVCLADAACLGWEGESSLSAWHISSPL